MTLIHWSVRVNIALEKHRNINNKNNNNNLCKVQCAHPKHFSYLWSTAVQKYQMDNFRSKQFINCKLHTTLSSVMKSRTVQLPPSTRPASLSGICTLYMLPPVCHAVAALVTRQTVSVWQCLCSSNPYATS